MGKCHLTAPAAKLNIPCYSPDAGSNCSYARMKKIFVFLAFIFATGAVIAADTFAARMNRAKIVEDSPSGKAFQTVLWPQVGSYTATVMQQCFPKGATPDTKAFTVVADILPNRTLSHAEVRPKTKMSTCFVSGFERAPFPTPPESFGERGIPIEIDMAVKQ